MNPAVLYPADLQSFERDGFLVARHFLDSRTSSGMVAAWESFKPRIDRRRDRFVYGELPDELKGVAADQRLMGAVIDVLGADQDHYGKISIFMNRLLIKDSSWHGAVTTHQDYHYFQGGQMLSAFVPLAEIGFDDGPLSWYAGSHKLGLLPKGNIVVSKFPGMGDLRSTPRLEPGDVVFMDLLTWHESSASLTGKDRPILQICYQPNILSCGLLQHPNPARSLPDDSPDDCVIPDEPA
jgi:Phytanoyl-CoA dioxygenase (PhyH)